jgi:hypothetical protein
MSQDKHVLAAEREHIIQNELPKFWMTHWEPRRMVFHVSASLSEDYSDVVADLMKKILAAIRISGFAFPLRIAVQTTRLLYRITDDGTLITRYVVKMLLCVQC